MKTLALLFLLAGIAAVRADNGNVLQNGDFANGSSHWDGDGRLPDAGNDIPDLSKPASAAAPAGIIVRLRSGSWTRVMQDFDASPGDYVLTIKYKVSPNLKFSDKAEDYKNIPGQAGIGTLGAFDSELGKWSIIINEPASLNTPIFAVKPESAAAGIQTATYDVKLTSEAIYKKGLYLLFPSGTGSINLLSVSLVPKGGAASS